MAEGVIFSFPSLIVDSSCGLSFKNFIEVARVSSLGRYWVSFPGDFNFCSSSLYLLAALLNILLAATESILESLLLIFASCFCMASNTFSVFLSSLVSSSAALEEIVERYLAGSCVIVVRVLSWAARFIIRKKNVLKQINLISDKLSKQKEKSIQTNLFTKSEGLF